jgi:hypothetical protein
MQNLNGEEISILEKCLNQLFRATNFPRQNKKKECQQNDRKTTMGSPEINSPGAKNDR